MLNRAQIKNAKRAEGYFGKSDSGYYIKDDEMRREWGGKGAGMLGLTGTPTQQQLRRLLHGLDPHSGEQLTAKLIDARTPGWDFTASLPKGCTTALENGDERIQNMLWEAATEAVKDVERAVMTRVRQGGQDTERRTGIMVWLAVEHPDTRPTKEDGMPDWDRHVHFVVFNVTWDDAEQQWKAIKMERVFELRKFFSHSFDLRMSKKLADAGYEIETKLQPDERGGKKYYTWDIKAAPGHEQGWNSINTKNSRRTVEVEDKEAEIVEEMKGQNPDAPDRLSKLASSKLAKTTRLGKLKDMTLTALREYWQGRITPEEADAIAETIRRAKAGENPPQENSLEAAMAFAIAHRFQHNSVLGWHDLAATAMERCMGSAVPEELEAEARRQGVLFKDGEVSTRDVLDQEQRILGFAKRNRATFCPLNPGKTTGLDGLSAEQRAAVLHVWNSGDQVMLIRGGAGTGKTTAMTPAIAKIGAPVVLLAPTSDASRDNLRAEGFKDANTVAAFLGDEDMQESVKGGGIIWVDEAGLLRIEELEKLCTLAKSLEARIVLQGDPAQHRAVDRDGNMLEVLATYGGLPVAKLTQIQRQKGKYAEAVAAIRDRDFEKGDAILRNLGWIVEGEGHGGVLAEYEKLLGERKVGGEEKSLIVVDPTHMDGDILTEKLRALRREKELIKGEEKTFTRLVQINLSEAQKRDAKQYDGTEVIQFFRKGGGFKAGDRAPAAAVLPHLGKLKSGQFAVFRETEVKFAVGDTVRVTNNGWDLTKKHHIDNGRIDRIKAFTRNGDIVLANGWAISKAFGHLKHGLVSTSNAGQSKTKDAVITVLNKASYGAMSARQAYVDLSRGRERGIICTDMSREELLDAIARDNTRKSATELFYEPPPAAPAPLATVDRVQPLSRTREFIARVQATARHWRLMNERNDRLAVEHRQQQERAVGFER